ncbi:helix-turn-helix domain-containing protein [Streptomyces microflavus]|uniref:helix-turn-helix domain-containing protein n=1 Tax=Streptomyces microflavus TaxID=1919 RepID=UPI0036757804
MPSAEHRRKAQKRRRFLHATGRPPKLDTTEASRHVRWLHDEHGMSMESIARKAGVNASSVSRFYNAEDGGGGYRAVVEKVLRVRPEPPPNVYQAAHVCIVGSQRRVQALFYIGFNGRVLADELGFNGHISNLWRLLEPHRKVLSAVRRESIAQGFEKLQDADPADFGISNNLQSRSVGLAKAKRWAPPHCWDVDTIDDPKAIPEWTGVCGTPQGRYIHERDGVLPVCAPCWTADKARRDETGQSRYRKPEFSPAKLQALLDSREWSAAEVGRRMGGDIKHTRESVYRWLNGERKPAPRSLDRLASALGVMPEDLEVE